MSDKFTCDRCRGVFTKGKTDEEAAAEFEETFPTYSKEDTCTVCDPCYREIMAAARHAQFTDVEFTGDKS